ncbi:Flagellar M-ring protein [Xanthomonas sacchari]|uniref:flagellar basal-body MS-ring/collar protein FliF n=1 Tax=Xanthomonas sacchari TaxID=56458 RepID=UPI00225E5E3B|nr:flagellar basal-body MS-ring/collar protein FliF [Xanthomonas sacchari]MCW0460016.1 Flagellar M-ring protein [Xanthomonas sacchari]
MALLTNTYSALSPSRRRGLLLGALAIVLVTAGALWWVLSSRQALLFGDLKESDAAEVSAALDEWKVPHSYTDDGSGILVEQSQVHPLRMRLVSAGIPKGGHVGFELFDHSELGVTEFAQRISYQRALQGEIERTIATIPGVQNVRVHLSIRRPGMFLAEDGESKASVAVALAPGARLDARQVAGIRNLVAAAVDGLKADSVIVVGPSGLQLSGGEAEGADAAGERGGAARTLAAQYESDIRKLLANAPGGENAAVSVNVQMNFDKVRKTSERVVDAPGQGAGPVVRRSASSDKAAEGAGSGLLSEQVEYAHGTDKEEVTKATGRIERISVAVVLAAPVDAVQQQHLQRLVAAAVGVDPARGDVVEIGVLPTPARRSASGAASVPVSRSAVRSSPLQAGGIPMLVAVLVGLAGLLVGLLAGWLMARRTRYLSPRESEAAATQIRAWLAVAPK